MSGTRKNKDMYRTTGKRRATHKHHELPPCDKKVAALERVCHDVTKVPCANPLPKQHRIREVLKKSCNYGGLQDLLKRAGCVHVCNNGETLFLSIV